MTQQLPFAGPKKIYCPCTDPNCNLFGTPRKKLWAGETIGHVANCPCNRCTGSRHKRNAGARERRIAKQLGGERSVLSGGISGYDIGTPIIKIEETSNRALVAGLRRFVESKQFQKKTSRLRERKSFPWAFIASWDGKAQWVLLDAQSFQELHQLALLAQSRQVMK